MDTDITLTGHTRYTRDNDTGQPTGDRRNTRLSALSGVGTPSYQLADRSIERHAERVTRRRVHPRPQLHRRGDGQLIARVDLQWRDGRKDR